MELDFTTTLAIVAEESAREFQTILMYVCIAALTLIAVIACFGYIDKFARSIFGKFKRLCLINSLIVIALLVPIIMYGGSKQKRVDHDGADQGIQFHGVYVSLTNEVVSASVTNTLTDIEVRFAGTGITTATEVSVRMSETNEWETLVKRDPYITQGTTNVLHFLSAGDLMRYPYWWVGVDKPAIHVETTGIEITSFLAGSHSVSITWTCENPKATVFTVQFRNGTSGEWITLTNTPNKSISVSGFFINRMTQWRIISTYMDGD